MKRRSCVFGLAAAPLVPAVAAPRPVPWPASRPTPALDLPSWQGPSVSLAALRGRPVLLNFWASWCPPCRDELPSLELLATLYESRGLLVYAVNYRETDAVLGRFIDSAALSLPVLRDRDGAAALAFGVRVFPGTVLVGADGRVRFSVIGAVEWNGPEARSWIEPAFVNNR